MDRVIFCCSSKGICHSLQRCEKVSKRIHIGKDSDIQKRSEEMETGHIVKHFSGKYTQTLRWDLDRPRRQSKIYDKGMVVFFFYQERMYVHICAINYFVSCDVICYKYPFLFI